MDYIRVFNNKETVRKTLRKIKYNLDFTILTFSLIIGLPTEYNYPTVMYYNLGL